MDLLTIVLRFTLYLNLGLLFGLPLQASHLCREVSLSTATFHKWRARFGGVDTSIMAHMKELDEENRRLHG